MGALSLEFGLQLVGVPMEAAMTDVVPVASCRKTAVLAGMASYLDAAALATTATALVLYRDPLGLDALEIGLLSGLLTITFAVGSIVGGMLGDRFGRRRIFTASLALYVLGTVLLACASNDPMLYAGVIATGFAIGADLPVSFALIAEVAPPGRRGRFLTATGLLWLVGALVPDLIAIGVGGFGELGGRILYAHLAIVALIVLVLRRSTSESPEWMLRHSAAQHAREGIDDETGTRITPERLPDLFRRPLAVVVLVTGAVLALATLATNTFQQFGTYMLVDLAGASVPEAALVSLLAVPVSVAAAVVLMRVADHPGRRAWVVVGAIAAPSAFVVPLLFEISLGSFAVAVALLTIGATFCGEGIYKVWVPEMIPVLLRSTVQGFAFGVVRIIAGAVAIVTPLLLGAGITPIFLALATTSIIGGALAVFAVPRLQRPSRLPH